MPENLLKNLHVKDIMNLRVSEPATAGPDDSIDFLLARIVEDPKTRHVYVVDDDERLIGSVRLNNIIEYLFPYTTLEEQDGRSAIHFLYIRGANRVKEIMNLYPVCVEKETPLIDMIRIMTKEKVNELPVVDHDKRIIGEVNVLEVIIGYLKTKKSG